MVNHEEAWEMITAEMEERVLSRYEVSNLLVRILRNRYNRGLSKLKICHITIDEPFLKEKLILRVFVHARVEDDDFIKFTYRLAGAKLYYQKIKFGFPKLIRREEEMFQIREKSNLKNFKEMHKNAEIVKITTLIEANSDEIAEKLIQKARQIQNDLK